MTSHMTSRVSQMTYVTCDTDDVMGDVTSDIDDITNDVTSDEDNVSDASSNLYPRVTSEGVTLEKS